MFLKPGVPAVFDVNEHSRLKDVIPDCHAFTDLVGVPKDGANLNYPY